MGAAVCAIEETPPNKQSNTHKHLSIVVTPPTELRSYPNPKNLRDRLFALFALFAVNNLSAPQVHPPAQPAPHPSTASTASTTSFPTLNNPFGSCAKWYNFATSTSNPSNNTLW